MIFKKYIHYSRSALYTVFATHLIISLLLSNNARAENLSSEMAQKKASEIEVDLSRFADDPWTVPTGYLMIESGYSFSSDREGGRNRDSHTFPEVLLRVGLNPANELRLGWDGFTLADEADGYLRATNDMTLGSKHRMLEEKRGDWLDVSALLELGIPVGASRNSSGRLEPGAGLLWLKGIGSVWEISGNTNISYLQGEERSYSELTNSLALDLELTDVVGTYVEYFHLTPLRSVPERTEHYMSSGLTFLLRDNLELDLWLGAGLNSAADNLIAGVGFAYITKLEFLK